MRKYNLDYNNEILDEHSYNIPVVFPSNLNEFAENVVAYIAGFVVRSVKKQINCLVCNEALEDNLNNDNSLKLLLRKQRG